MEALPLIKKHRTKNSLTHSRPWWKPLIVFMENILEPLTTPIIDFDWGETLIMQGKKNATIKETVSLPFRGGASSRVCSHNPFGI